MAKRHRTTGLSATFLAAYRPRLDAIGPWTVDVDVDADGGTLDVEWADPPGLRNAWVPLALRFRTEADEVPDAPGLYDPDDRMFGLYDLFVARRDEFIAQLQAVAAETQRVVGRVVGAVVEVDRYLDPDEEMCHCELRVSFEFADDDEHSSFSQYDPETGAFGRLEG